MMRRRIYREEGSILKWMIMVCIVSMEKRNNSVAGHTQQKFLYRRLNCWSVAYSSLLFCPFRGPTPFSFRTENWNITILGCESTSVPLLKWVWDLVPELTLSSEQLGFIEKRKVVSTLGKISFWKFPLSEVGNVWTFLARIFHWETFLAPLTWKQWVAADIVTRAPKVWTQFFYETLMIKYCGSYHGCFWLLPLNQ